MIKENISFSDKITNKIYEIMKQNNLGDGITLFPMLRKENDKLLLGSLIEINDEELFNKNKVVRPKYWVIIDINDYSLIELNNIEEKDYMDSNLIPFNKEFDDTFKEEMKELEKYSINKNIQYREYLMNDIKKEIINTQSNILDSINNTLIVDNEKVSATDYLIANIEEEINNQVKELVNLITTNKYSSIIYYYQSLIEEILNEYKNTNNINIDKMKLASQILESYYGEYCGIKYFFNV
ncbi:MAG: hypothetical protein IJY25_04140 [Bacilli bacterium]|nr:hypothetical protein [Bacilli bacterium]